MGVGLVLCRASSARATLKPAAPLDLGFDMILSAISLPAIAAHHGRDALFHLRKLVFQVIEPILGHDGLIKHTDICV